MPRYGLCLYLLWAAACVTRPSNSASTTDPGISPSSPEEIGDTSTQSVGKSGGTVGTPAQSAFAAVPPGALDDGIDLSVLVKSPGGMPQEANLLTNVYDFGPDDTTFLKQVILTLAVATPPAAGQQAMLAYLDANQIWQALLDSSYNPSTGTITATTNHFTPFSVMAYGADGTGCTAQRDPNAFCAFWQLICNPYDDACGAASYTLGGQVTGLDGSLTLRDNRADALVVCADGNFTFPTGYNVGDSYNITLAAAPANQNCILAYASGTVRDGDIKNILVTCTTTVAAPTRYPVGGVVRGLGIGETVTLALADQSLTVGNNGDFIFPEELAVGASFAISVAESPDGKACSVTQNAHGTVSDGALDTVVTCIALPAPTPTPTPPATTTFVTGQRAALVLGAPDFITAHATGATGPALMNAPQGSAYLASNGALYVSDTGSRRALIYLQMLARNGQLPDAVLGQTSLDANVSLLPSGALASTGHFASFAGEGSTLVAADPFDNRVMIYAGQMPVANSNASWALGQDRLSHNGNLPGCGAKGLNAPLGVAMRGGVVVVADTGNHRVLLYNSMPQASGAAADLVLGQPDLNTCIAPTTTSAKTLSGPQSVWTDGTRLLVADTNANRVLVWQTLPTTMQQPADAVIGQTGFFSNGVVKGAGGTAQPTGVTSDGNTIWTSSQGFHRVEQWTFPTAPGPAAMATAFVGQPSASATTRNACDCSTPSATGLSSPGGVSVVGTTLVVADTGNNRCVIFASE